MPAERAHLSDFGRNDSFNTCLVEIETDAGLTGLGEAKVGVGIALWDLLGQSLGQPLWRLLGGRYRDRVPAYASGGWAPVGAIGKQMHEYVDRGHRAVKMRVGLQDQSVDDSVARVREVRGAWAPTSA